MSASPIVPRPCAARQVCLGDQPAANLSSEAPDLPVFIGQNTGWDHNAPPLGGDWVTNRCFQTFESTLSQQDADAQAAAAQLLCLVNPGPGNRGPGTTDRTGRRRNVGPYGWTRPDPFTPGVPAPQGDTPPNGPNIKTYNSTEQECTASCPSGTGQTVHKSEAGAYIGLTQNFADTVAATWACINAYDELICLGTGRLIGDHCMESTMGQEITASGKHPPFTFSVVGTLPEGLRIEQTSASNAALKGILTKAGDFQWAYKATDSKGNTTLSKLIQLSVAGFIDDTDINYPDGERNQDYIWDFKVAHQGKVVQTVPTGCTLIQNDLVHALQAVTPDVIYEQWALQNIPDYRLNNIAAFDAFVAAGGTLTPGQQLRYEWMQSGAPLVAIADCTSKSVEVPAVIFTGNDLPPGLVLTEDGVLAGVPVKMGIYTMHIHLSDSVAQAECDFFLPITIQGDLQQFETCANSTGFKAEFSASFAVEGEITWGADGLPPWAHLSVNDSGTLATVSGDPLDPEDSAFLLRATLQGINPQDGVPFTETVQFPGEIGVMGLPLSLTTLPKAKPGKAYHYTFAPGGLIFPPYAFSIGSGALPNGLSLNPTTGEISGVPSSGSAGFYEFGLRIRSTVTGFTCGKALKIELTEAFIDWTTMVWDPPATNLTSGLHPAADASAGENEWQAEANSGLGGAGQSSTYQNGQLANGWIGVNSPSRITVEVRLLQGAGASWSIALNGSVVMSSSNGVTQLDFTALAGHAYEIEVRTFAFATAGPQPNIVQITGKVDNNPPL